MASEGSGGGKPFWSDYEVTVDRDGIPHYTGASPALMKEYTRRVKFAFHGLEGEGKDEEAEAAALLKKQMRFGRRLIDALHGEAWRAVEHLVVQPEKLKKKDGYEEVLNALGSIEKEGVIRKTEAFDKFFESTRRARGEAIDAYLRRKNQAWRDLCDLDETSAMSKDLLSYFVLKGCNLSREDRRSILLANKSTYDQAGIEQSLRVSFHDLHEREKQSGWRDDRKKPMKKRYYANEVHDGESPDEDDVMMVYYHNDSEYDEEDLAEEAYYHGEDDDAEAYELGSDAGASGDDDVYQAYVTMEKGRQAYKDARKKLRDVQKSRGFYQNGNWSSRDQAKEKEKSRSRCAACGHIGHWAGDSVCPKSSAGVGPKKGKGRGKSQSKGKKKSKGGAYAAAPCPMLFSLEDPDDGFQDEEGHSFMVHTGPNDDANANDMQQDEGHTFTDDRRKVSAGSYSADWETVTEPPMPGSDRPAGSRPFEVWAPDGPWESSTKQGRFVEETQEVIKPTMLAKIEVREVSSFAEVRPSNMEQMKAYQLQGLCEKWGIQTGGAKKDLLMRLEDLFAGREVPKKKCTVQFVKLVEEEPSTYGSMAGSAPATPLRPEPGGPRPCPQRGHHGVAESPGMPPMPKGGQNRSPSMGSSTTALGASAKASGLRPILATDLEIGKPLYGLQCCNCGAPMVARQTRGDGSLFFSCAQWPNSGCSFTRPLQDGLDIINGRIPDVRHPRSPARSSAGN
jgi:hypothetical protein